MTSATTRSVGADHFTHGPQRRVEYRAYRLERDRMPLAHISGTHEADSNCLHFSSGQCLQALAFILSPINLS
jgi:hypothetical protein